MKGKNIILMSIAIITFFSFVVFATYAYLSAGTKNISNLGNVNASSEQNRMVFDTMGGDMSLTITAQSMQKANVNTVAASNNTTLIVNFTPNTDYSMVCSYDIVYEWTSTDRYKAHSSGISTREFIIKAILEDNEHVYVGKNIINYEDDLAHAVGNNASKVVVTGAQIDGTGSTTSSAVWNLTTKFYNANGNQNGLANKTYAGRFKVTNVSCTAGTVQKLGEFSTYWYAQTSSKTFPAMGGTAQTSGPSAGQIIYIAQDSSKYYTCGYAGSYGKEVCLTQPYTQYGLDDHTRSTTFTAEQKASARAAILQAMNNAGIGITNSNCSSGSTTVSCSAGHLSVLISNSGVIYTRNTMERLQCVVSYNSTARCYTY